jgi:hypothetical protein
VDVGAVSGVPVTYESIRHNKKKKKTALPFESRNTQEVRIPSCLSSEPSRSDTTYSTRLSCIKFRERN